MTISRRVSWLKSFAGGSALRRALFRSGVGSFAIGITNMLLLLGVSVILPRVGGVDNFGTYAFVLALANIAAILAQFGVPLFVLRETAAREATQDWRGLRAVWTWSGLMVTAMSGMTLLLAGLALALFAGLLDDMTLDTFLVGLAFVPAFALAQMFGAQLRGLRAVLLGALPVSIALPAGIVALALLFRPEAGLTVSAETLMALHAAAAAGAAALALVLFRRRIPDPARATPRGAFEHRIWLGSLLHLVASNGFQILSRNAGIIVVGLILGAREAGLYAIAVQFSILISFGLRISDMFVNPYISRFNAQGDYQRLQHIITLTARAVFAISVGAALVLILAGKDILGALYDEAFAAAFLPLAILAIGQLINAACGPTGTLLIMTGHERFFTGTIGVATFCHIVLLVVLVPFFGMAGAAIASSATFAIWILVLCRYAWRRLQIDPSILGLTPDPRDAS